MDATDKNFNTSDSLADNFSPAERLRYARHFVLPGFGPGGQKRLKNSSVLVIGAGGLGCPVLLYLAAAGVGKIGIVDFDRVEESNLQRQVLFGVADIGLPKAEAARVHLLNLNPHIRIDVYNVALTRENALELISAYDVIADGSDNFPTRYLVNDACVISGKPLVYGAISAFEGQVAVFNALLPDGSRSPNYRDLFPQPPDPGAVQNCAEGGVLGVLPGIIGSLQAGEVLKIISKVGEPLLGKLFLFDAASFQTLTINYQKQYLAPIKELIDYEGFCGVPVTGNIREIDASVFLELKASRADFQLIDVREPHEFLLGNLGGELIPLAQIQQSADRIRRDCQVILHCQSGKRSRQAILQLEKLGFDNLVNLKNGMNGFINGQDSEPVRSEG